MKKAKRSDKTTVVDILVKSFDANKSVNSVIKQDHSRTTRINVLMEYSFEMCFAFGEVFLSDDENACALILFPDKKRTTLKSLLWSAKLIYNSIGLFEVVKVLKRESLIKQARSKELMYYIWFVGVNPEHQKKGIGTQLLNEVLQESVSKNRAVFLETSAIQNLSLYQKCGFEIYRKLELGYTLYMMKREPVPIVQLAKYVNLAHVDSEA